MFYGTKTKFILLLTFKRIFVCITVNYVRYFTNFLLLVKLRIWDCVVMSIFPHSFCIVQVWKYIRCGTYSLFFYCHVIFLVSQGVSNYWLPPPQLCAIFSRSSDLEVRQHINIILNSNISMHRNIFLMTKKILLYN